MIIASLVLAILGAALLSLASIAFFRAKDVFVMLHIIKISNFYIIPLILLAVELGRFSWISLAKTLVIIALNIAIANLLCYMIAKRAIANNIAPDADFKNVL